MVWTDVAVVDGSVGFRCPARLLPVRVRSDLGQQPELWRTALVVPPTQKKRKMKNAGVDLHLAGSSEDSPTTGVALTRRFT